jgi:hypothetical protein
VSPVSFTATLIFRYFLRYFSSTHRTDLSRFRGTFHRFDPVGFAIFAIPTVTDIRTDPMRRDVHLTEAGRSFRREKLDADHQSGPLR